MDAVVAELAVAKVPEPVPIVVDQILMIGLHGGGAHPQIPVEPGRGFHWLLEPDRIAIAGKEKVGLVHVADLAIVDKLDGLAEAAPPAALRAAGRDPFILTGRLDQLRTFPYVVADRLFDVGVFTGLHGPDGGQSMP